VKRVLLLATTTGYQIRSFGEAASALGVRLLLASDRCDQLEDPWWDGALPVRFHDEDSSLDAIVGEWKDDPPDGVLAVGDRPVVLAARAAAAFRLPGHPPEAAAASRNKLDAHVAFREAGLLVPSFRSVSVESDAAALGGQISYPCVVKPLALSASRGVIRVNDRAELGAAFERVGTLLRSPDVRAERDTAHERLLIEDFVPGREFAIEGVLTKGKLQLLAIFDKPDPLDGPFFEETIYVTPSREPLSVQRRMLDTVAAASRALGLHHGPVHAECRVNQRGVYVLEVAARPIGGLCSRALRFCTGQSIVSLEEVLLRHALGEDITPFEREPAASGVLMLPIPRRGVYRGVEGVDAARAIPGIDDIRITAKTDSLIVPLPEGRSYLGFVFAHGVDAAHVEEALRAAHARLDFTIDRDLTVSAIGQA
jgi:biotin carboxylase